MSEGVIPNPLEYGLENGIIFKGDKPLTQQGNLAFTDILGTTKNRLLLGNKEGVYVYNIRRDKFKLILNPTEGWGDDVFAGVKVVSAAKPFIAYINVFRKGDS